MEVTVSLSAFSSESSAGSEKAKKMGLISAGFGRYRTKKDGPVTHKIVKGKLVASPEKDKHNLFSVELDYADFPPEDVRDHVTELSPKLKSVNVEDEGPNGYPTATLVGSKPDLMLVLKDYYHWMSPAKAWSECNPTPYTGNKSTFSSKSSAGSDKLYCLRNFRFVSYTTQSSIQRVLDEDFRDGMHKKKLQIVSCRKGPRGDMEATIVGQYDDLKRLVATMCLTSDPEVVNQFPIVEYEDTM